MARGRKRQTGSDDKGAPPPLINSIMPRHAPFYVSLALGVVTFGLALVFIPKFALSLGSNALFVAFLTLTFLKLRHLTPDYLREHAKEEDTPVGGIFLIVLIVVIASVVSLFLALDDATPDPWEVTAGLSSVLLGWFTVQAMGALHYAYEYYQAPDEAGDQIEGGLTFAGDEDPDGYDFIYFSFTVGTSVATSDTKAANRKMRRMLTVHLVFSHLYNTIILASAVNVLMSMGGG